MTADASATPAIDAAQTANVAERVLGLVRARESSAEAEVTVRRGTSALTRFANGFIHQNVAEDVSHVLLRVCLDGRSASSSLDAPTDDETLGRLVDGVLEAARVRPEDPGWPGLSPISAGSSVDHWDEETAGATPDARAQRVAGFVAAAKGLDTAGQCSTSATVTAFANSAGQSLDGRATMAEIDGVARTPTSDGSGRHAAARLADLDGREVGERAAQKARDAEGPTDLSPGRYEVVLEPHCLSNMLTFLFLYGFNGRAVEEGRSFARIGEAQFDRAVSIREDAGDPAQVGIAFDIEGTPRRPLDIVREGDTKAVLHTRRTARAAGVESTGNAIEGGDTWGAVPASTVVAAGTSTSAGLIAGVERGVLVSDFWYTRILDPRTMVVTGLTRNGVWLIEDGRIFGR